MLYDNIQYIDLLTKFFQKTKKSILKRNLFKQLTFLTKNSKMKKNYMVQHTMLIVKE